MLQTLYLVHELPSWGNNLTSRVVGRPKVSLLDTGLAARLNHLTPAALRPGMVPEAAGGLFEAFVAGELRRQLVWSETDAKLFHFRDRNRLEVDLIVEAADRRVAGLEMKAAGTVDEKAFRGLTFLRDRLGDRFSLGVVLYSGKQPLPFGRPPLGNSLLGPMGRPSVNLAWPPRPGDPPRQVCHMRGEMTQAPGGAIHPCPTVPL